MNPSTLIGNQHSALIRQLAHFYLRSDDLQPEVTGLNDIFLLPADRSKRNARSYESCATSKIQPLFPHRPHPLG